jgi:hypothetical protein
LVQIHGAVRGGEWSLGAALLPYVDAKISQRAVCQTEYVLKPIASLVKMLVAFGIQAEAASVQIQLFVLLLQKVKGNI